MHQKCHILAELSLFSIVLWAGKNPHIHSMKFSLNIIIQIFTSNHTLRHDCNYNHIQCKNKISHNASPCVDSNKFTLFVEEFFVKRNHFSVPLLLIFTINIEIYTYNHNQSWPEVSERKANLASTSSLQLVFILFSFGESCILYKIAWPYFCLLHVCSYIVFSQGHP